MHTALPRSHQPESYPPGPAAPVPIVVDLDGTLIHTDMLHESAVRLLKERPWDIVRIPFWTLQSKAILKAQLGARTTFDAATLPYHQPLLDWLRAQKAAGRSLVLCTASDQVIAHAIADHLQLFDDVIASDGNVNLSGRHKANALQARWGEQGFDYVGNSRDDLAVWAVARCAVVVNASTGLVREAQAIGRVEKVLDLQAPGLAAWSRVVRVHQWLKNFLLLIPLLAAHELTDTDAWLSLVWAFVAFSLCASAVYVGNDLLDLESDRLHPRKRQRPFASGLVPVWKGVVLAPLLLLVSAVIGWSVGLNFLAWMALYFVLTCAYTLRLKRMVLIDCLTLALLYTLRIVAGSAAVGVALSFWILTFSLFLFLSLAFIKRYAELSAQLLAGASKLHGRGYLTSDATLIQSLGIAAGYAAAMVLALYVNSDTVVQLYRSPDILWGVVPVMLFWISWMWLQAHRGKMHDDPLVYAVKDRASLLSALVFAVLMFGGATGWPW